MNGSGLDADDLHSIEQTDMWVSGSEPSGAWIEYEFDKVYKLHEMLVWNYNGFSALSWYGLKAVTVEYSEDGESWTPLDNVSEFSEAPGANDYAADTVVDFNGLMAKHVKITAHSNWSLGGVFNQYGLSEVCFLYIPLRAREPQPQSGATDVDVDLVLNWRPGREAAEHNVYIGTDEQAVRDSNVPVSIVTEAQDGPISLDLGETYYWKVNEVNDVETPTTWQGDVWSFTTQEYLVVEDFESYNAIDPPDPASNTIFASWEDGYATPTTNGALVGVDNPPYTETRAAYVHSGAQAMPYSYGNNGKSSVGTLTLTGTARDFTRHGVGQLSLWFRGESTNAVEPMYVALNGIAIAHTNPNATQVDAYEEWVIPLQDFATLGVTLNNVTSIAISIGTPTPGAASGAGTMSFDDLRLYRIAP